MTKSGTTIGMLVQGSSLDIPSSFVIRASSLKRSIKCGVSLACIFIIAAKAEAQIQVDLKFKRLQYIAYEPVVATLSITNLAGRDIDLRDADGQSWLGFEVTGNEGQPVGPISAENRAGAGPLKIATGQRVTQQV